MPFREFQKNTRELVRVVPSTFRGHDIVDIRIYGLNYKTKELTPTKKGISLNVDTIPELVDALLWALGQPCDTRLEDPERHLSAKDAKRLAGIAWRTLRKHGSAVHWDSAERIILSGAPGFSKWDLHFVLATRSDLFERVERGCYRARNTQKEP